ncbi:MAG: DUF2232 domain-containing protein [Candidatus Tectimicrobiota bacterium]
MSTDIARGQRQPEVVYLALFSGFLTLLPVFATLGSSVLNAVAPFPLIVLALKYPWRYLLVLVGLEGLLLLMLGHPAALILLTQSTLVALVMGHAIRQGWSIARAILGSLMVPLLVGAIWMVLYGALAQQGPQELLTRYVESVVRLSQEYARTLGDMQEGDDEQLTALVAALPQLVVTVLPALLVISHVFTHGCNYMLVRRYGQRSQPPIVVDPEDITCWRASDHVVWVFVASGVALLTPHDTVSLIGINVLLLTLAIYFLQGLAIALFWGRRVPLPVSMQCALAGIILLLAGPLCLMLCTVAGLFDLWVDFRRQRRHTPRP